MPNRITEFGWHPDCFPPNPCSANLDTTTTSCDGARTGISSWGDYNDYVRISGQLDGYAVWILSDATGKFADFVAVKEDDTRRPWFDKYVCFLNA
ncbi:MAG: hypothetical protein M1136_08870 [Chloroflexi bacterium]|nr:hypothetical protein [Chloroflexota bacterium]